MAQQPFTIGILKQITDQYDAGEISYGRMVEMLNEVAMKWYEQKKLLIEIMEADEKDGLYEPTISKMETVQTPKEKANQLTDAFYQYLPLERYVTTSDGDLCWEYDGWENAKQCALIACNEVLGYMGADRGYEFWTEVKQEIEKL